MKKLISIIVPCYNVENYIKRCVNSIICQTIGVDNIELILVNDASTDHTLDKLIEFENQYEDSIIVINLEKNVKQGGARNIGIEYASSDYIGFVDADDWIEPTMYEKLYMKMTQFNCDMVACDFVRDKGDNTVILGSNGLKEKLTTINNEEERKQLFLHGLKGGISKLYNKSFLINNNIYFLEGLSYEDNFFSGLVMYYINSYYVVEEYLYHYFVNFNSTTLSRNSIHHFDRLKVELLKLEEYMKRGIYNKYKDEIEYNFLKLFYSNTLHILFLRFDKVPYNIYLFMRQCVIENFSDYLQNKYVTKQDMWWLNTITDEIAENSLNEIANKYLNIIKKQ